MNPCGPLDPALGSQKLWYFLTEPPPFIGGNPVYSQPTCTTRNLAKIFRWNNLEARY